MLGKHYFESYSVLLVFNPQPLHFFFLKKEQKQLMFLNRKFPSCAQLFRNECVFMFVCVCVSRRNDLCLFPSLQSFSVGANCSTVQSVSAGLSPSLPKLATNCFLFLLLLVSCSLISICWPSNKTCPECCLLKRKHRNLQKCNCPSVLNWV